MTDRDRHGSRECKIFMRFAEVCGLAVQPDSTVKRQPPEPDILCKIEGEGFVAFEMVELIDPDLAQRTYEQIKLQRLFEEAYQGLPINQRTQLKRYFGDALVHVAFRSNTSSRAREHTMPLVLAWLQELGSSFEGTSSPAAQSSVGKVVRKITISRGDFIGPCFDVEAVGYFADPTLKRIRQKFTKVYNSSFPVELLAYYELQPVFPEARWVPQLHTFITQHLGDSQFRRVWVYNLQRSEIKYVSGR
jgi:hypothetical protein